MGELFVRLMKQPRGMVDGKESFSVMWVLMDNGLKHPIGIYADYEIKRLVKSIEEQRKEFDL